MGAATVAVIEDDDSMRQALRRLLGAAGFGSAGYASAEEYLKEQTGPVADCIVCDQNLPMMTGLELLDAMNVERSMIPLILITAFDRPGLCKRAADRGVSAFLIKPFSGLAFLDAVKAAIALSGKRVGPLGQ
ncbi:MAG: response regulator transcription factor [Xanthobacteraceae bacterium]